VDDFLRPNGALEGLERVRRQGKARCIGFTCPGADYEAAAHLLDQGCFGMINVHYNLLNPTAGMPLPRGLQVSRNYQQLIDKAAACGVGVAIISPLGAGVLNDHAVAGGPRHPVGGGPAYADATHYNRELAKAAKLAFLSRPGERSLAQAAVGFILMHPGVTTVLGGYSEIAHLEEFVACSGVGGLSPLDMARVEMVLRANFGRDNDAPASPSVNHTREGSAVPC
jgi:L-glyceraldehyde 3-phosphate reductase